MNLQPKTKRLLWVSAIVLVILLAFGAFFTWTKFFREEKEVFANEEEHFKYGSLGAEGDRGIPYYLWMVLPRIFSDLMKLGDIGEDRLLGRLLSGLSLAKEVVNGPGDDCAVMETRDHGDLLVLKTDCVVAGVHFLPTANALDVGWKAMMRPLSDFAATSAVPKFALITLIAPEQTNVEWVQRLYRGLGRAAKRFKVSIVGGETSQTRGPVAISVSVVGFVEKDRWASRCGAKVGDDLFVTGRLGGAVRKKHLEFTPRIAESRWLTKNFSIHAMME